MEKVKEESRRKSEELEYLRNTMQRGAYAPQQPIAEPVYAHNSMRGEAMSHRGFQDLSSSMPASRTTSNDDYIMDFSKPAGYQPPTQPSFSRRGEFRDASPVARRRSLEPQPLREDPEPRPSSPSSRIPPNLPPAVPSNPPPHRRSSSVNRDVIRRSLTPSTAVSAPAPAPTPVLRDPSQQQQQQQQQRSNEIAMEERKPVRTAQIPPVAPRASPNDEVSELLLLSFSLTIITIYGYMDIYINSCCRRE